MIPEKDLAIIRDLAKTQLEAANSPRNLELKRLWTLHNGLRGERPMTHIEINGFLGETVEPLLRCEDAFARQIESVILMNTFNFQYIGDDTPVPPYYPVGWRAWLNLLGMKPQKKYAEGGLAYKIEHVIGDLEADWQMLGESSHGADRAGTEAHIAEVRDAIGDILPVKLASCSLCGSPTQHVVLWMGMENMFTAMVEHGELFQKLMGKIAEGYVAYFKFLEREGLLLPTAAFEPLVQGSYCFNDELKTEGVLLTTDVWGYMDSQETVGVSPGMFRELIFPCYKKIAECFGLLSYGCCEPVHMFWDCLGTLGNMRKVSISAWCDENYMGERLRGSGTIYFRKPSPNLIGVDKNLDEDEVRKHINATLDAARGCKLEFAQRDVYTIHGNVGKARRYAELIRLCAEENWKP
ncbi:MAG: hypothetical protein FWF03_07370 [Defluviitaleaceae bacterium]|nr:hypothetical protein [Defluviitaleaceae bacterium]